MDRYFFDYENGESVYKISDNMAMNFNGDLMMRMNDHMAMDLDTGEIHYISKWLKDDDEQ